MSRRAWLVAGLALVPLCLWIGGATPRVALEASALACAQVLACIGYGRIAAPLVRNADPTAKIIVMSALGAGVVGALVLLIGHAAGLHRPGIAVLLAVGDSLALGWSPFRRAVAGLPSVIGLAWRRSRVLTTLCVGTLATLMVSAASPPMQVDELEYHWASPVFWASRGSFVKSPFRYSDGAALAEIHYTVPAVFGLPTAAHLLHLASGVLLCSALALVAQRFALPRLWAVAAVVAAPPVILEASVAYSDVAFAAFAMAALCALLTVPGRPRWWLTGCILAVAASVKFLAILALPGFLVIAATVGRSESWAPRDRPSWLRASVGWVVCVGVAIGGVAVLWSLHTHAMTGHWLPSGDRYYLASVETDPLAPGRVPTIVDIIVLPLLWVVAAVLGGSEPYGDRTGIMVLVFLPLAAYFWRHSGYDVRRRAGTLFGVAISWLAADVVLARTRFNIYGWLLLALAALLVVEPRARASGRTGTSLRWLLQLAVIVGLADSLRKVPLHLLP